MLMAITRRRCYRGLLASRRALEICVSSNLGGAVLSRRAGLLTAGVAASGLCSAAAGCCAALGLRRRVSIAEIADESLGLLCGALLGRISFAKPGQNKVSATLYGSAE